MQELFTFRNFCIVLLTSISMFANAQLKPAYELPLNIGTTTTSSNYLETGVADRWVQRSFMYLNTDNPTGSSFDNTKHTGSVKLTLKPLKDFVTFKDGAGPNYGPFDAVYGMPSIPDYTRFSSLQSTIGKGIGSETGFFILRYGASATSDEKIGELVVDFSIPQNGLVIHFNGLGDSPTRFAYYKIQAGQSYTFTKLSGTSNFIVDATTVTGNKTLTDGSNTGGSVLVNGSAITTLKLDILATNSLFDGQYRDVQSISFSSLASPLTAVDDAFTISPGGLSTGSVLANDTDGNGKTPAVLGTASGNVQLSGVNIPSGFTLNADGTIRVASSTLPGTYTLTYKICEQTALTNCRQGTVTISVPKDFDGDGILDVDDLDADNDGIPDTLEKYCNQNTNLNPNKGSNPGQYVFFNWAGKQLVNGATSVFDFKGITYTAVVSNVTGTDTYQGTDLDQLTWSGAPSNLLYNFYRETGKSGAFYSANSSSNPKSYTVTITAKNKNSGAELFYDIEVVIFDPEGTANGEQLRYTTGGTPFKLIETMGIGSGAATGVGTQTITYTNTQGINTYPVYSTTGKSVTLNVTMTPTGGKQGSCFAIRAYCDTDNDTAPNFLDLDSDNDGCFDAVEGEDNVLLGYLNENGSINIAKYGGVGTAANNKGVPNLVNAGGAANVTLDVGQGVGESRDPNLSSSCNNYWIGNTTTTNPTNWDTSENWKQLLVPASGKDIVFATAANNNNKPAVADLRVAQLSETKDRVIGNLINGSDKNLVVTTGDQLTINGIVQQSSTGSILVESSITEPTGTLLFTNPVYNPASGSPSQSVNATVQFYNKGYDCNCGFYSRKWQYFGIPVAESLFPASTGLTANRWDEFVNGNKWTPLTLTADKLHAFQGYEITSPEKNIPTTIYNFTGSLITGSRTLSFGTNTTLTNPRTLTNTPNVNYGGINLIGNPYTAAIPINTTGLTFNGDIEKTVYIFNTGTRDEWRKLDGSIYNQSGFSGGQYLAVPQNLAGSGGLPSSIPSMHAFLVRVTGTTASLNMNYAGLTKNTLVSTGTPAVAWRSTGEKEVEEIEKTEILSSIVMDVMGKKSANRVWIFAKEGTTRGFDEGWDGKKMPETGMVQLCVEGVDSTRLQVATVPDFNHVSLGLDADMDGKYTLEFSFSDDLKTSEVYLSDMQTGTKSRVVHGGTYTFDAIKGTGNGRFVLTYSGDSGLSSDEILLTIENIPEINGAIRIVNKSTRACSAFISTGKGAFLQRVEVKSKGDSVVKNLTPGVYMVRFQNAEVNDVRKVRVE